jgi:hypothetical protein
MRALTSKGCKIKYPFGSTALIYGEFAETVLYSNRMDAIFDLWCANYREMERIGIRMSLMDVRIKKVEMEIDGACAVDYHISVDLFTKLKTYF